MQTTLAPIPPTELITPRLHLRALTEADRAAFIELETGNRAFFARYAPPPPGAEDPAAAFDRFLGRTAEGLAQGTGLRMGFFFRDASLPGSELLGQVSLSDIVRGVAQRCNIGYRIAERFARRGLMSEAVTAMVEHAFSPQGLNLHRVECSVQPANLPSLNLAIKLGFEREGYFRKFLFIGGAWQDHIILARTNPRPLA